MKRIARVVAIVVTLALVITITLITGEAPAVARGGHHGTPPNICTTASPAPTATPSPTPTDGPPTGSMFDEQFNTPAAAGDVAAVYSESWQPYPDGTGGKYFAGQVISVHDGYMDVSLNGTQGAAGTFGTPSGAWGHIGGTFAVRAKATGGAGNGAAFMLWPTDNVWSEGEVDFPEGNFDGSPSVFQHSMTTGQESSAQQIPSGVDWTSWHTYSETWVPGESITYFVDGHVIGTITHDVPTTAHRFMFQVGNWGAPGHLLIDWVADTEP